MVVRGHLTEFFFLQGLISNYLSDRMMTTMGDGTMFKKTQIILLAVLITGLFMGCAQIDSRKSYDTQADFSALKTYSWEPGVEQSFSRPEYCTYFLTLADTILESRGYKKTSENPDFLVQIPSSERFKEVYATPHGAVEFFEGKLIIQVRESVSRNLVWEGVARVYFSETYSAEAVKEGIKDATEELLNSFPPE